MNLNFSDVLSNNSSFDQLGRKPVGSYCLRLGEVDNDFL